MAESNPVVDIDRRGVARITFDRPDRANAVDGATLSRFHQALQAIAEDEAVRVVVVAGNGKHFCAGADLSGSNAAEGLPVVSIGELCDRLDRLPKPVIAAVHGACIGAGLAFAACSDIVLATDDAIFSMPEVRLGFPPATLIPVFMAAMGARQLRRYMITGERFGAEAALRSGLVHELVAGDELDAAVARAIDEILAAAPKAVTGGKAALRLAANQAMTPELKDLLRAQSDAARGSDEAREGSASFREKRKPSWVPE